MLQNLQFFVSFELLLLHLLNFNLEGALHVEAEALDDELLLFDVFRKDQPFWLIGMSWIFLWVAQIWQHVQNMRGRAGLQ